MKALFFVTCSVLSILLVSCGNNSSLQTKKSQVVRLNLKGEPATLDPRKGGDVISSHMHFLLFEGLVRLHEDGSITPAQAESFEISEDRMVYTFHLRDATWSDGSAVTALDFEKSWKDILNPAFPSLNAHLLYPIRNAEKAKKGSVPLHEVGITARDEKTLVITLEKPTPYFLDLISFCVFFPVSHTVDEQFPEWSHHAGEHFVSNGPFILKEWKHNNEIIAIRNPLYWDHQRVIPDTIHCSMIDNEMTALQMFENNELDMIGEPLSPLPVDALPSLKQKGRLLKHPVGGTTMIAFNVDLFPFNNRNIRKALAYAIDRKSIVENITQMGEQVANNVIPPILKNKRDRAFFKDNDIEKAKELLALGMKELGITLDAFEKISYYYSTSDLNHKIAQAIQQQWLQNLGIRIQLENVEHKVLMNKLTKRDFALAQTIWLAQYNDQMNILERFKFKSNVKNYPNWENPEYIRLIEQSFYETGEQRVATLESAEQIFADEMPIAPIYHWEMAYMKQPHLEDIGLTPIGDVVFEKLSFKEKLPAVVSPKTHDEISMR
jgi:oligopeptide transport system substrate-binding protein